MAALAPATPSDQNRSGPRRFAAVDAGRGLGAVAIACYHIHRYGPVPEAADAVLPVWLQELLCQGRVAVPMFFVIAGFVTAYALRNERLGWSTGLNFALRRVLRLGIPYWTVVLLAWVLSAVGPSGPEYPYLTGPVSLAQLLANVFFLQDILGYESVSAGMWFVCIDLQLGLLLFVMLWLVRRLACGRPQGQTADALALAAVFLPLALASLFRFGLSSAADMWIHYYFFMPCLGGLAWWALEGRVPRWWFWGYVAAVLLGLGQRWALEAIPTAAELLVPGGAAAGRSPYEVGKVTATLVTGVAIYLLGRAGRLDRWFTAGWLQYLGRISYSLFLIHYPVSWLVARLGYRLTGDDPEAAVAWLVLAFAASLAAADLLYRCVERPSLRLGQRLRPKPNSDRDP